MQHKVRCPEMALGQGMVWAPGDEAALGETVGKAALFPEPHTTQGSPP